MITEEEIQAADRSARLHLFQAIQQYAERATSVANVKDLAAAYAYLTGITSPPQSGFPSGPPPPPIRPSREDWPA